MAQAVLSFIRYKYTNGLGENGFYYDWSSQPITAIDYLEKAVPLRQISPARTN
jgi:hypothetical protein